MEMVDEEDNEGEEQEHEEVYYRRAAGFGAGYRVGASRHAVAGDRRDGLLRVDADRLQRPRAAPDVRRGDQRVRAVHEVHAVRHLRRPAAARRAGVAGGRARTRCRRARRCQAARWRPHRSEGRARW